MIIALLGVVFDGYIIYFIVLFGILTIVFGAVIILKMYFKIKNNEINNNCTFCNHSNDNNHKSPCSGADGCPANTSKTCSTNGNCQTHGSCFKLLGRNGRITNQYSFILGVFRGATPCLKFFILAPLLIIVDLPLAFIMILVFATASTIYPIIGFLSAKLLTNVRRFEPYIQLAGALVLISVGVFMIYNQLIIQNCALGI